MTTPTIAAQNAPNAGLGRLYYEQFTIPAGTLISAPASITWPLEDNYLIDITTRIPPGPYGVMGFRILWAAQQIVPWGNNSWLIANDEEIRWPANTAVTVSGLVVQGYNTGTYAHTVYLRALISTLPPALSAAINAGEGTVALPASQVGPLAADVNSFVFSDINATDVTGAPLTETAIVEPVAPEINPSISLVSVSQ